MVTQLDSQTQEADAWIAIEPPGAWAEREPAQSNSSATRPPSFRDSQFATILRRQRLRPLDNSGLKNYPTFPSRFIHLTNSFEFAGWGAVIRLVLPDEACKAGKARVDAAKADRALGQFMASAVVGNAVLGGVFYTIPAVAAVAGVL
jgi:hypothetical protein